MSVLIEYMPEYSRKPQGNNGGFMPPLFNYFFDENINWKEFNVLLFSN